MPLKDGTYTDRIESDAIYYNNTTIYDRTGYLKELMNEHLKQRNERPISYYNMTYALVIYNGQIRFVKIGRTLLNILPSKLYNIKTNEHLLVCTTNTTSAFPDFRSSKLVMCDYKQPIQSKNVEDWVRYIRKEQPFYLEDWLNRYEISKNIPILEELFGENSIQRITQKRRNEKLNNILT